MIATIVAFLGVRGTVAAALGVALLAFMALYHFESRRADVAEAKLAGEKRAGQLLENQIQLYQDREKIIAEANQKRGKVNELRQKKDYRGLSDMLNAPDGVRRKVPPNPPGSPKEPTRYTVPGEKTGTQYEAPR